MEHPLSFKRVLVNSILLTPAVAAANATFSVLSSCLTNAGVKNIQSSDTTWATETTPWQLRLKDEVEPAAVAHPADIDQLAETLACARNASVKVSALGGGHSFVAYGYGNPGNLVVSMDAFTSTSYDASTELFTMGGGARVGPALKALWDAQGRHFPHVRHGKPGVVGSSIGGGFGSSSRLWGTPMDNIESVEYMLYNGTIMKADRGSDLYFAAMGAGSSFGIITSITTKTWKPTYKTVTNYTVTLGEIPIDAGIDAFLAVQDFGFNEAPNELALRFDLEEEYAFSGYHFGDPAEFDAVMKPLLDRLAPIAANLSVTKFVEEFWKMETLVAVGVDLPDGGTSPPRSFYIQSLTTTTDHLLTAELLKPLFQGIIYDYKFAGTKRSAFFDLWGGVSRDVKEGEYSFAHANNAWLIRFNTNAADNEAPWPAGATEYGKSVMKPFEDALVAAGIPLRGFANYRDSELTEPEWSSRLYGSNYARLKSIKAAYDPEEMFTSNSQSISL
ncbi:hypothetical protein QTJ16_000337 [Diplocarpon rosae]|uniref:FAD-binding PCMH-type domain-containing protein n=1 Tax=Diplocarpon rosae TaxID=946125 RepID=A0AAD9T5R1_9HELO|nr:hypothetical protein QTJ16_000337 [Diplocarpon rosae]PBP28415.1 putative glucooligosaccharide oxidase [Diplocarpon rosae]